MTTAKSRTDGHRIGKAGLSILEVLDHPELLGEELKGPSWDAWRAFLCSLFALPMTAEQLEIYKSCTGRAAPPAKPLKEVWAIVGRRGGKSRTLAMIAVFLATFRDYRKHLARGERGIIRVMASRLDQAKAIFDYISGIYTQIPFFKGLVARETAGCFELTNGITIETGTADYRGVRGHTYVACLCDEIAFWENSETSTNPDSEILGAIRPALSTIPGSVLLCASSPHARKGELFAAFSNYYAKEDPEILIWKATTREMNSNITEEYVKAQLARDLELNSAEYLCEWRGDLEDFLSLDAIRACVDKGVYERPPELKWRYWGYTDLSGGSVDSSTLSICHREGDTIVEDCHREIKAPHNPEAAVAEFSTVLRSYRLWTVHGDKYASAWPVEKFKQAVITYD
jgi:hypothetical protein